MQYCYIYYNVLAIREMQHILGTSDTSTLLDVLCYKQGKMVAMRSSELYESLYIMLLYQTPSIMFIYCIVTVIEVILLCFVYLLSV